MKEELDRILEEVHQLKERIKNSQELENFRVKFLGRKGIVKEYLNKIVELPEEERKSLGQHLNYIKNEIQKIIEDLEIKCKKEKTTIFDFRHPGKKPLIGHPHIITSSLEKIIKIFLGLGFSAVDSPEIVSEYENFDSLNIPVNHPARDMQDTLWIDAKFKSQNEKSAYIFRTQTSSYQVELIKNNQPPLRVIVPGKVFRYEATDRSHDFEFYQLEGLAITKDANLAELKGVFEKFFSEFFEKKLQVRFRPGYFPFVEPGLEVDLECVFCSQKAPSASSSQGCANCKNTGFLEIAGAGMIHPYVLKQGGLNPNENSGYAFGMGVERMIMLKHKIDDIRLLHSGDLRFIKQF